MKINNLNLRLYLIKENSLIMKKISLSSGFKIKEVKDTTIYKFIDSSFVNCKMNNIN